MIDECVEAVLTLGRRYATSRAQHAVDDKRWEHVVEAVVAFASERAPMRGVIGEWMGIVDIFHARLGANARDVGVEASAESNISPSIWVLHFRRGLLLEWVLARLPAPEVGAALARADRRRGSGYTCRRCNCTDRKR